MSILELFCSVDDFWQQFAQHWHNSLLAAGQRQLFRRYSLLQWWIISPLFSYWLGGLSQSDLLF